MPTAVDPSTVGTARRWAMLAVSTSAQAAAAVTIHGPAFLIPVLHHRRGLSLASSAFVAATPMLGVMLTLVAWGWVVDRTGERFALLAGLGATAVAGAASTRAESTPLLAVSLFVAGAAAASTRSAGGRPLRGGCCGGEHRICGRRGRRGLVPAASARTGDGDPADGTADRRGCRGHPDRGDRRPARHRRGAAGPDRRGGRRRARRGPG